MWTFKRVKALKPHDGHKVGAEYELREDEAATQAAFGWVEVIGNVVHGDEVRGRKGARGKAAATGGSEGG